MGSTFTGPKTARLSAHLCFSSWIRLFQILLGPKKRTCGSIRATALRSGQPKCRAAVAWPGWSATENPCGQQSMLSSSCMSGRGQRSSFSQPCAPISSRTPRHEPAASVSLGVQQHVVEVACLPALGLGVCRFFELQVGSGRKLRQVSCRLSPLFSLHGPSQVRNSHLQV